MTAIQKVPRQRQLVKQGPPPPALSLSQRTWYSPELQCEYLEYADLLGFIEAAGLTIQKGRYQAHMEDLINHDRAVEVLSLVYVEQDDKPLLTEQPAAVNRVRFNLPPVHYNGKRDGRFTSMVRECLFCPADECGFIIPSMALQALRLTVAANIQADQRWVGIEQVSVIGTDRLQTLKEGKKQLALSFGRWVVPIAMWV